MGSSVLVAEALSMFQKEQPPIDNERLASKHNSSNVVA
jgi:hypothetical protein